MLMLSPRIGSIVMASPDDFGSTEWPAYAWAVPHLHMALNSDEIMEGVPWFLSIALWFLAVLEPISVGYAAFLMMNAMGNQGFNKAAEFGGGLGALFLAPIFQLCSTGLFYVSADLHLFIDTRSGSIVLA